MPVYQAKRNYVLPETFYCA